MNNYKLSLEEIHSEMLKLLIEFDSICKTNNFTYFLAYGTLLGAVRHHGFIPWDDDADVWMPREDAKKLIEYFNQNMKDSSLGLVSRANTENYEYGVLRFTNNNFIYESDLKDKKREKMGIFIDIYILDNYGNTYSQGKKLFTYAEKLNDEYTVYVNPISFTSKYRTFFKRLYNIYLHLKYGNNFNKRIDLMIEEYIKKYTSDSDKFVGVPSWDSYGQIQFERSLFENSTKLEFEGYIFNCPKDFHVILERIYGDYMALPPEEKRKPHHNYSIVRKSI